jgi:branched-chain amino acid transport system ATP-binding protein
MLEVRQLSAHYGMHQALQDVEIHVRAGEVVSVLGANGAGKSTLLRCIAGLMPVKGAEMTLSGKSITGLKADQRVEAGIAVVPEGRGVFGDLTVRRTSSWVRFRGALAQASIAIWRACSSSFRACVSGCPRA